MGALRCFILSKRYVVVFKSQNFVSIVFEGVTRHLIFKKNFNKLGSILMLTLCLIKLDRDKLLLQLGSPSLI